MPGATPPFGLRCPDCEAVLRPDRTKMNIELDVCPQDHGIFLDHADIEALVEEPAAQELRGIAQKSGDVAGPCPNCAAPFKTVAINGVAARACGKCGSIWFATPDLRAHVLAVRRRAYGEDSMAGRVEVVRDAASFMAAEVVAGILTDYQLEHDL